MKLGSEHPAGAEQNNGGGHPTQERPAPAARNARRKAARSDRRYRARRSVEGMLAKIETHGDAAAVGYRHQTRQQQRRQPQRREDARVVLVPETRVPDPA